MTNSNFLSFTSINHMKKLLIMKLGKNLHPGDRQFLCIEVSRMDRNNENYLSPSRQAAWEAKFGKGFIKSIYKAAA